MTYLFTLFCQNTFHRDCFSSERPTNLSNTLVFQAQAPLWLECLSFLLPWCITYVSLHPNALSSRWNLLNVESLVFVDLPTNLVIPIIYQQWLHICLQITDEDAEYLGQIHEENLPSSCNLPADRSLKSANELVIFLPSLCFFLSYNFTCLIRLLWVSKAHAFTKCKSIISVELSLVIKSVILLRNEILFVWQDFCYPESCAEQHKLYFYKLIILNQILTLAFLVF